jgi:hypothetical protein
MFAFCNITSARSSTDSPRTRYRMYRQWDTWHMLTSCRDAGRVTLADQLPAVPAVEHMTLADRLLTFPAVGHMTLAGRLPTIPAVGHMTLADHFPPKAMMLAQQWDIRHWPTSYQLVTGWEV